LLEAIEGCQAKLLPKRCLEIGFGDFSVPRVALAVLDGDGAINAILAREIGFDTKQPVLSQLRRERGGVEIQAEFPIRRRGNELRHAAFQNVPGPVWTMWIGSLGCPLRCGRSAESRGGDRAVA